MKIWPLNVWREARAVQAQRRFLAIRARRWPLRLAGAPRLPVAQFGNLRGSVGVELPLGPTEALRLASYRLRADWERPLSPDGRRRWAEAWLQLARRA